MVALIYAHVGYPLSATCLEPLKDKIPVESILRVEIGTRSSDLLTPYLEKHYHQIAQTCSEDGYDPHDDEFFIEPKNATERSRQQLEIFEKKVLFEILQFYDFQFIRDIEIPTFVYKPVSTNVSTSVFDIFAIINSRLINPIVQMHDISWQNVYRFEFSHEFGYLRLSDAARKKVRFEKKNPKK